MPRESRQLSNSGVYHVMNRGINKQDIFHDKEDRQIFLEKLVKSKERSECKIYAYCLMSNHVHLLIGEGNESISQVMLRLGTAYASWYNKKYDRVGHLFQGRYCSEPVDTDSYFLTALRYIHRNPVKAGIVENCSDYTWTSYHEYINYGKASQRIADAGFGLDIAGGLQQFEDFHKAPDNHDMIDIDGDIEPTNTQVEELINQIVAGRTAMEIIKMKKAERNMLIRAIKALPGVTQRQIEKVTGLSRNIIQRA